MKSIVIYLLLILLSFNSQAQTKKPGVKSKPKTKSTAVKNTVKDPAKAMVKDAEFLIGTWKLVQAPSGDGMNMSQTWAFTKTDFNVEGYPALQQKGKYTVIKQTGDVLTLKLFEQQGHWGTEDKEHLVTLDKVNGKIRMGWLEFKRKE